MKRNTLRIIGGEWRSRKLTFPANEQLRPTPDRVRETLFNWLQNDIYGARCLDLFAGSGALGLEALSRGAAHCTFIETHAATRKQLEENLSVLKTDKGLVINSDALRYLQQSTDSFDIIFLDPPFNANLWLPTLELITEKKLLAPRGKIYIETPSQQPALALATHWDVLREKKAGDVRYQLITPLHSESTTQP